MRVYVSIPEILSLLDIVEEHIQRNFPGVEPPMALRKAREKFGRAIAAHRKEIAAAITASKTVMRQSSDNSRRPRVEARAAAKRASDR